MKTSALFVMCLICLLNQHAFSASYPIGEALSRCGLYFPVSDERFSDFQWEETLNELTPGLGPEQRAEVENYSQDMNSLLKEWGELQAELDSCEDRSKKLQAEISRGIIAYSDPRLLLSMAKEMNICLEQEMWGTRHLAFLQAAFCNKKSQVEKFFSK